MAISILVTVHFLQDFRCLFVTCDGQVFYREVAVMNKLTFQPRVVAQTSEASCSHAWTPWALKRRLQAME
jgi:hypothetical protein